MRDWRKEKASFAVFTLPGAFWIIVFFTLPLLIVWSTASAPGAAGPDRL
jgi:hypothetical protein